MSESINEEFELYVKTELGDIAVINEGKYISPKIQNYYKIWQYQAARIAELEKVDARWQLIETAPKDGTEILVLFKRIGVKSVAWTTRDNDPKSEYAIWCVDDNKYDPYPLRGYIDGDDTHWMPLPTMSKDASRLTR